MTEYKDQGLKKAAKQSKTPQGSLTLFGSFLVISPIA